MIQLGDFNVEVEVKNMSQFMGVYDLRNLVKQKISRKIVSLFLYHNFNNSLSCATFPTGMKCAKVILFHKRNDKTDREGYQPISILLI